MMRGSPAAGPGDLTQDAVATHTATGAETSFTTANAALSGGATGFPVEIECTGSASGLVSLTFASQAQKIVSVAPNQSPVKIKVPKSAFPNRVNSVPIGFQGLAAGTFAAVVKFNTA